MNALNAASPVDIATTLDRVQAIQIAHVLIEAGLEASVETLYVVTVPNDQQKRAHDAMFAHRLKVTTEKQERRRR